MQGTSDRKKMAESLGVEIEVLAKRCSELLAESQVLRKTLLGDYPQGSLSEGRPESEKMVEDPGFLRTIEGQVRRNSEILAETMNNLGAIINEF